jgi:hypothetical protein
MDYKDLLIKYIRDTVLTVFDYGDLAHYAANDALDQLKDSWEAMVSDGVSPQAVDKAIEQDVADTIEALTEFLEDYKSLRR